jgi:two-component system phosphate regulon response regulator PhoB
MDLEMHRVTRRGKDIHLSPGAYDLLKLLMGAPDHVFTREEIRRGVWGDDPNVDLRNVDLAMKRMRESLVRAHKDDPIDTVRGVGYRISRRATST